MIVRIDINFDTNDGYSYSVIAEHQTLYDGSGLSSIVNSLAAAVEGLSSDVAAAEISFGGVVSGTYPLATIATRPHDVAEHAVNTTNAVNAALQGR
jgi:hypothetical protein